MRQLVDACRRPATVNTASGGDVGEQRDLLLAAPALERPLAAAEQDVGLDADLAQLLHRVLGRLGLELAGGARCTAPASGARATEFCVPELEAQLADRLEERQRLDVADRAADLDDEHVDALGAVAGCAP